MRQLENILEYAAIINSTGIIDVGDLPDEISFRCIDKNDKFLKSQLIIFIRNSLKRN